MIAFAVLAVATVAVFAFSSCAHTHAYAEVSVLQMPTCSEVGVQRIACECGDFQVVEMPKADHTPGEWKVSREATCTMKGVRQQHCKECDSVMKTEAVEALGHDIIQYGAKAPSCAEEGHGAYEACSRCSYSTYEAVEKLPHTPGAEATCTEPQLCTVCEGVVKPPKGHYEVVTTGMPATCSKVGLTDRVICVICNKVLQEAIEIPKRAHTTIELPAVAATCSATGRTRGEQCTVCGDYVVEPTWVSRLAHKYSGNKCSVCGEPKSCRHLNNEQLPKIDSTCTKFGLTKGSACKDCGVILTPQYAVDLVAHKVVVLPGVPATPNTPGLTEGSYCSVCKTILKQQDVIPALSRSSVTE